GYLRAEVLRQLHGEHAKTAGCSMNEHAFARLQVCPAQEIERARRADEHGACFFERHGSGLVREESVLRHTRELRMCGEFVAASAIHRIAWREPRYTGSDAFNGAGEIDAKNRMFGSKPT